MPVLLQIALGGAIGAVLRYVVAAQVGRLAGPGFPWGTFAVNALGCFVMGVVFVLVASRGEAGWARAAPFLMPGLLGGFTTFSAFSLDALVLVEGGRPVLAAAYAAGTVLVCLAGVFGGAALARVWVLP